jgi:uncharacterized protein YdgA (DUF945 family)
MFRQWCGGGDEGDRTPDLGIANAALSHLSYIPTRECFHIKLAKSGQSKIYSDNAEQTSEPRTTAVIRFSGETL